MGDLFKTTSKAAVNEPEDGSISRGSLWIKGKAGPTVSSSSFTLPKTLLFFLKKVVVWIPLVKPQAQHNVPWVCHAAALNKQTAETRFNVNSSLSFGCLFGISFQEQCCGRSSVSERGFISCQQPFASECCIICFLLICGTLRSQSVTKTRLWRKRNL